MQSLIPRYLAGLALSRLADSQLNAVAAAVKVAAPTSNLVKADPAMANSATAMDTKSAALIKATADVGDARTNLKLTITDQAQARSDLVGEIRTYVTFTTNTAKSPADVHNAGLPSAAPRPPKNQPPDTPQQIDVKPPKKGHGKTVVSVYESGPTRHQYVAEQSGDGTTWSPLGVSHGKTRTVTGPTGTKVWVRFAMVRGALQSPWSVPILVNIP